MTQQHRRATRRARSSRCWSAATCCTAGCCGPRGDRGGVSMADFYQTLGVARDASHDEIRKAFRKLARSITPTRTRATRRPKRSSRRPTRPTRRSPTRASASSTTSCCGSAPSTRAPAGSGPGRAGSRASTRASSSRAARRSRWAISATSCRTCSAAAAGGRRGGGRAAAQRGADLQVDVTISFDDSLQRRRGARAGRRSGPVSDVSRHGRGAGHHAQDLPGVPGSRRHRPRTRGSFALSHPCPRCRGNGTIIEHAVPDLSWQRRHSADAALHRQDPGRRQGRHEHPHQGQGRGGHATAAQPGDLYVVVRVEDSAACSSAAATTS